MKSLLGNHTLEWLDDAEVGIVDELITPTHPGRVKCLGVIWPAQFHCGSGKDMVRGERVAVLGKEGITLLVVPESECLNCSLQGRKCPKQCSIRIHSLNKLNLDKPVQ